MPPSEISPQRTPIARLLAVACVAAAVASPASGQRQVAYVSLQEEGRVAAYSIDEGSGAWSLLQTVDAGAGAGPMALSPDGRRLAVAIRDANGAVTLDIGDDGRLTLLGSQDIGGSSPYIAFDRTGRWLLAAYYADGKVSVHRIDEQGRIAAGPVQEIATNPNAHAVVMDASNRFLFVPHTGANAIHQFRFDEASGTLTPNQQSAVHTPEGTGPRHLIIHPHLDFAYAINETASTITAYRFDRESGTLEEAQSVPTLPEDFGGRSTTADIHVTPDGRFLYGSNRGHDSIVAYAIDPASGELTRIGWFETEQTPRSFALDGSGRFLYAAGQGSDRVAAYEIDSGSGALKHLATYDVGGAPTWIAIVALE